MLLINPGNQISARERSPDQPAAAGGTYVKRITIIEAKSPHHIPKGKRGGRII